MIDLIRIKMHLSYDGTNYYGWQSQKNPTTQPTVQNHVENALKDLLGCEIKIQGSGRTDRGAHARDQVVHFDLDQEKFNFDNFNWVKGLNRFLPEDIKVQSVSKAPSSDFHAVKSAISKTYIYNLQDGPAPDPLNLRYSHWVESPLDLNYLNELSRAFIGEKDFKSFQTVGTPLYTTVREILDFKFTRTGENFVQAEITGTGFLKQMVRNIMGTVLHQYWKKPFTVKDLELLLEQKCRSKAYGTAPAKGLVLHKVNYPINTRTQLDKTQVKT